MAEPELNAPPPSRKRAAGLLLGLLALYLGAHLGLRLLVSRSVDVDEADIVLFSQSLEWGYHEQPPLYSWGVWPLTQVLGVSIFTITLFRLLVLGAIHVLLYLCTLRLTRDPAAALLAAFAPLAVPTLAWNAIFYLTHTLLACALGVATLHALVRLRDEGRTRDYLVLGLVVGLGGMSKYNFALLAAALFGAALTVPSFRARLLDRRLVLSAGVAAVVVVPHGLWLLRHWDAIREGVAYKTGSADADGLAGIVHAAGNLVKNSVIILVPLVPFFFACFPQPLRRRDDCEPRASRSCTQAAPWPVDPDARTLLRRHFVAVAAALVAQIALGGFSRFHERWLQPLLVSVPVYLFTLLRPGDLEPRRVRRFGTLLAVCALGLLAARATQLWYGGLDRGRYPLQMDLDGPAAQLRDLGLARATIVAHDREIAGNLRLLFPQARVLCAAQPHYVPPLAADGPCFLVWNVHGGVKPPAALERFADRVLPGPRAPASPITVVAVPPEKPGRPVNYLLVTPRNPAVEMARQR